jgi:DNA-binding NtrC family response regulator
MSFRYAAVLRERREDIPLLASHFLQEAATRFERVPPTLSANAYALLLTRPWPGGVRDSKNVMEAAAVLATGPDSSR